MLTAAALVFGALTVFCLIGWRRAVHDRRYLQTIAQQLMDEIEENESQLEVALAAANHNYEAAKALNYRCELLTAAVHTLPGPGGESGELDIRA